MKNAKHKIYLFSFPQNVSKKCGFSYMFFGEDMLLEGYVGDHPDSNSLIFFLFLSAIVTFAILAAGGGEK